MPGPSYTRQHSCQIPAVLRAQDGSLGSTLCLPPASDPFALRSDVHELFDKQRSKPPRLLSGNVWRGEIRQAGTPEPPCASLPDATRVSEAGTHSQAQSTSRRDISVLISANISCGTSPSSPVLSTAPCSPPNPPLVPPPCTTSPSNTLTVVRVPCLPTTELAAAPPSSGTLENCRRSVEKRKHTQPGSASRPSACRLSKLKDLCNSSKTLPKRIACQFCKVKKIRCIPQPSASNEAACVPCLNTGTVCDYSPPPVGSPAHQVGVRRHQSRVEERKKRQKVQAREAVENPICVFTTPVSAEDFVSNNAPFARPPSLPLHRLDVV
ncbi:hypothetical protein BKA70DRAFT_437855 [Coprinopsis sp. MPI-PUGE-AT-0042]|nr:hypothetical protein BKA70DRAFT_437855 [Coprinopsis sp. MPI-PUGE-AT-0042]